MKYDNVCAMLVKKLELYLLLISIFSIKTTLTIKIICNFFVGGLININFTVKLKYIKFAFLLA